MCLCAISTLPALADRSDARHDLVLVGLFALSGVLAIVVGSSHRRSAARLLSLSAVAIFGVAVLTFAERGIVGAVLVGGALALPAVAAAYGARREGWSFPRGPLGLGETSRLACTVVGIGLVVVFGTPVVNAWLRGVAPYDLGGLTMANLADLAPQLGGVWLFLLGLVAFVGGTTGASRAASAAALVLSGLLVSTAMQLDDVAPPVLWIRYGLLVGGPVLLTALIIATVIQRPSRSPAANT